MARPFTRTLRVLFCFGAFPSGLSLAFGARWPSLGLQGEHWKSCIILQKREIGGAIVPHPRGNWDPPILVKHELLSIAIRPTILVPMGILPSVPQLTY